jgi:hypothetical protein
MNMIGFTSGNWTILPQIIKVKGDEIEVAVKAIKWRPILDTTGELVDMAPLGRHWSYQCLLGDIRNPNVQPVHVKLMVESEVGFEDKRYGFRVEYLAFKGPQEFWAQPTFGREKKKPVQPPKRPPADYNDDTILPAITQFGGETMASTVITLLLNAFEDGLENAKNAQEAKVVRQQKKAEKAAIKAAKAAAKAEKKAIKEAKAALKLAA